MKKFMFIYHGAWDFSQEAKDAWGKWFEAIADHIVDSGNPFGPGREVTPTDVRDLSAERSPAVGYTIVSADDMDHAVKLLSDCPIVHSVRVYEAAAM
jgi:hypothetical protein